MDPIRCWWRTSADAVRTGETFSLLLTCAVIEAEGVQVVPDETQLNPLAIQLVPFEVVSGSHPPDLRSGQRRFFQYEYIARVIARDAIGKDVPIPPLVIHYRVNSRVPGNQALQGRDLTYVLPAHSVRVVSVVPADATDIRDTSDENFSRIESLDTRAGVLEIVALTLMALGSLMTLVVLVSLARRARKTTDAGERLFGEWTILGLAARELAAVQREAEQAGWTEALAGRALAALRVVATCALGRAVSQRPGGVDAETGGGGLVLRRFWPRGRTAIVSSSVTSEDIARGLAGLPAAAPPGRRQQLESLAAATTAFTAAQYGRPREMDRSALDQGVADALAVTRSLRAEWIWPRPQIRRWTGRRVPELERQT